MPRKRFATFGSYRQTEAVLIGPAAPDTLGPGRNQPRRLFGTQRTARQSGHRPPTTLRLANVTGNLAKLAC